jgi:hypothetical protein
VTPELDPDPDAHEVAADLLGRLLPQLQVTVARLGVSLDESSASLLDTWADLMPLRAGTSGETVVSFSSNLDRLALRASGEAAEFGPAVGAWLDALGATGSRPPELPRVGSWLEVRQDGGADGGWSVPRIGLEEALGAGPVAPDGADAIRSWAGRRNVAAERSVAGRRPSTAVAMSAGTEPEDGLASVTALASALRVPVAPDAVLGALAQGQGEVRVTCRLTQTGCAGFGVARAGLPIGVVIDLWRLGGGDHHALAVLQGALLADDPTFVEWWVGSGGAVVLAHYHL